MRGITFQPPMSTETQVASSIRKVISKLSQELAIALYVYDEHALRKPRDLLTAPLARLELRRCLTILADRDNLRHPTHVAHLASLLALLFRVRLARAFLRVSTRPLLAPPPDTPDSIREELLVVRPAIAYGNNRILGACQDSRYIADRLLRTAARSGSYGGPFAIVTIEAELDACELYATTNISEDLFLTRFQEMCEVAARAEFIRATVTGWADLLNGPTRRRKYATL